MVNATLETIEPKSTFGSRSDPCTFPMAMRLEATTITIMVIKAHHLEEVAHAALGTAADVLRLLTVIRMPTR